MLFILSLYPGIKKAWPGYTQGMREYTPKVRLY